MKINRNFAALAVSVALFTGPAVAQAPPTPPPSSVIAPTPTASLSVTTSSSRVALGADPSIYSNVTLANTGTAVAYCQKGDSTVTADTSTNYLVRVQPNNGYASFWGGPSTYVACITATGSASVDVSQRNGAPLLGVPGGGGGGGGGSSSTYKNASVIPTVQNAAYAAGQSLGGLQTVSTLSSGLLQQVQLASKGGSIVGVWAYVWNKLPAATTCTDRTNFVVSQTDNQNLVTPTPLLLTPALGVSANDVTTYAATANLGAPFVNNDTSPGANLYVCLLASAAVTPPTTTDYRLNLQAAQ